ncbi:M23 family metallopeptidase [Pantanalinema rosaneae CENA516]|uniref:M23 family metallopeptidase n=1 Tax=Pantanalinema rosaneae TaxID=1620701 RepID=UPI003D6DC849
MMTSQHHIPNFQATPLSRSLFLTGASLITILGVWGSSAVQAQAPDMIGGEPVPVEESAPLPVGEAPMQFKAPLEPIVPVEPELPADVSTVAPVESASPLPESSPSFSESYIDSTNYSIGATERTRDLPTAQPVRSLAAAIASPAPTYMAASPVSGGGSYEVSMAGQTTTSVRDYYRRTIRPPAQLGNGNVRLIFPLSIPAPITSAFGWRIHPISGDQRFHSGTDLGAPIGTPVLAAYAGQVAIADFLGGYGLTVTLQHNKGDQQTLYAHLSEIFVKPGDQVKQGEVIGRVGSTGNSTGPHLHFEFRQLTADGWVVLDAGAQLEYALAQLVKSIEGGQIAMVPNDSELGLKAEVALGLKGETKPANTAKPANTEQSVTLVN